MSRFGSSSSFDRVSSNKTNPPKTHEYLFNVIDPPGVSGQIPQDELVRFSTDSVEVSAFDIETEEFISSSVTIPYAVGIDFSAITVGFTEQTNYEVIKFLDSWKNLMFNLGSDRSGLVASGVELDNPNDPDDGGNVTASDIEADTVNPLSTYTRNAEMELAETNLDNPVTAQYDLKHIFPSSIDPVNYDYADDGEPVSYQVEFAVQRIQTVEP